MLESIFFTSMLNCCNGAQISDYITPAISVISLALNILFYIFVAPKIGFKFQRKSELLKQSTEFLSYLSEINSYDSFEHVPTTIRNYCISIKLLFKNGDAPDDISDCMERIFQLAKKRKGLTDSEAIKEWELDLKNESHQLRTMLAKITGIF